MGHLPTNGVFSCQTVPGATDYDLQYSTDNTTFTVLPASDVTTKSVAESNGGGTVTLQDQNYATDMNLADSNVFWRIGAKVAGEATPFALADATQSGYVFSTLQTFSYNGPPPPKDRNKQVRSSKSLSARGHRRNGMNRR